MKTTRVALTAAFFALPFALNAQNLLTNGDFTDTPTVDLGGGNSAPAGWTGTAVGNLVTDATAGTVTYNGAETPLGSFIEQTATTSQTGVFYALEWSMSNQGNQNSAINATLTSGVNTTTRNASVAEVNSSLLINAASTNTTVRFTDAGSGGSTDPVLTSASLSLANGSHNVANLGVISVSSQLSPTAWLPVNAVDGFGPSGSSNEVFHSGDLVAGEGSSEFFDLDFTSTFSGLEITQIVVDGRNGFGQRKGDTVDIFDVDGVLIESIDISDDTTTSLTLSGLWQNVGNITVTEVDEASVNDDTLNLAELRVFANFVDGVAAVPESGSYALLAGLLGLGYVMVRRRR